MSNNKKKNAKQLEPLDEGAIKSALETAGYSFEVRLFYQLKDAGLDPVIGHLCPVDGTGELSEIDLLASTHERFVQPGTAADAEQKAVIQVKKLQEPRRFVGVLGEPQSDHAQRVMRAKAPAGVPSREAVRGAPDAGLSQLLLGPGGFGGAFDPWLGAAYCVHWAIAERMGDGTPKASGDKVYQRAMDSSIKAAFWLARQGAEFRLAHDPTIASSPHLRFFFPTLIVETECLYTYDPQTRSLEETDWLVYQRTFDIGEGEVVHRTVDVVSASGVDAMIERYKASSENFKPVIERHVPELKRIITAQKEWWDSRSK